MKKTLKYVCVALFMVMAFAVKADNAYLANTTQDYKYGIMIRQTDKSTDVVLANLNTKETKLLLTAGTSEFASTINLVSNGTTASSKINAVNRAYIVDDNAKYVVFANATDGGNVESYMLDVASNTAVKIAANGSYVGFAPGASQVVFEDTQNGAVTLKTFDLNGTPVKSATIK